MEIKAKTSNSYEASAALIRALMFKKSDPKKCIVGWFIVLIGVSLLVIASRFLIDDFSNMSYLLFVLFLSFFLLIYSFFILPRITYKSQNKLADIGGTIVFTDTEIKVESVSANYSGTSVIDYSVIVKVIETGKYLFIFQNRATAYVVEKSSIEGGTANDLREKFMPMLGKKYILCNY